MGHLLHRSGHLAPEYAIFRRPAFDTLEIKQGDGQMYARVTPFKMKPGTKAAATERLGTMKDLIMGMPGMQHFINVMNEDGTGYVIALVESEAASNANAETVKAAWGQMAEFLEEMPTPQGYDVVADWS